MTQHIDLLRRLNAHVERITAALEAAELLTDFAGIDRAAKAILSVTKVAVQVEAAIHDAEERQSPEVKDGLEARNKRLIAELRAAAAECGIDLDDEAMHDAAQDAEAMIADTTATETSDEQATRELCPRCAQSWHYGRKRNCDCWK